MEYFLGAIHWLDALTPPLETHLQKLAETIKALLAASEGPAEAAAALYTPQRQPAKPVDSAPTKTSMRRLWLPLSLAAVACLIAVAGGVFFLRPHAPPAPPPVAQVVPPAPPPVAPAPPLPQVVQKPARLIPEAVPFLRNADREALRNDYLAAPDHKAVAISYNRMGFTTGQTDDEMAKTAALESCRREQQAIKNSNPCWLYAVGNTVVYTGGTPPMPPAPWLIRNPAIETPFVAEQMPLLSERNKAIWAKGYPQLPTPKAAALSPRGQAIDFYGGSEGNEDVRRSLEACGHMAGVPCMIVAVDNTFVVPIPTTMKVTGFFYPATSTAIAPEMRSAVVERFGNAMNAWNAVAVGTSGAPGVAINAADEKDAIEKALSRCGERDRDCRVIALGPFLVQPLDPAKEEKPREEK
jgi:adenylate cyclase